MAKLSSKWQKIIIWLAAYTNIIGFFLAGGYIFLKTEDEDVKASAKTALLFIAAFKAIDIFYSFLHYVSFNGLYKVLNWYDSIFAIIEIVSFIVLVVLDLCGIKIIPVNKIFPCKCCCCKKEENVEE